MRRTVMGSSPPCGASYLLHVDRPRLAADFALEHSHSLTLAHVRLWHKADMLNALTNVRFGGQSGYGADLSVCPLVTQSRH